MLRRLTLAACFTLTAGLPVLAAPTTETAVATISPAGTVVLGTAWMPAWLVGISTKHHVIGPLYFGGAGYGGISTLGAMGYGGATIGVSGRIVDWLSYDASFLFGGAGGSAFGTVGGGIAVEPSVGLTFGIPLINPTLRVGYLATPTSRDTGGLTIGLKFDLITLKVETSHR